MCVGKYYRQGSSDHPTSSTFLFICFHIPMDGERGTASTNSKRGAFKLTVRIRRLWSDHHLQRHEIVSLTSRFGHYHSSTSSLFGEMRRNSKSNIGRPACILIITYSIIIGIHSWNRPSNVALPVNRQLIDRIVIFDFSISFSLK